jgi:hypothetical protein
MQDPGQFRRLSPDVLREWIPVIIGHLAAGGLSDERAQAKLAAAAYPAAPEEFIDWLSRWIDELNRRDFHLPVHLWGDCWDDRLETMLLKKSLDPSLRVRLRKQLLDDLFSRHSPHARSSAESLLVPPLPRDKNLRRSLIVVAKSLLMHATDAGWPLLRPLFDADPKFVRRLLRAVASEVEWPKSPTFLDRLTEAQLADLFVWLSLQFPKADGYEILADGPRRAMASVRNSLLTQLHQRGTRAALDSLDQIASQLPDMPQIGFVRVGAEQVMLEKSWTPLEPPTLLALLADREARLVESGDQLLDVVIESLRRYEAKLQGETPASFMLWDGCRPKEEERLSDALKLHLEEDLKRLGIIANREVVIRSGLGDSPGERTDIHIDALKRGSRAGELDRIRLVVEVKGCWHREVRSAMRTQLRDRYLLDNTCRHGLYVVGWFLCDRWEDEHASKAAALESFPTQTAADAQAFFDEQASDLSGAGLTLRAVVIDAALR